MIVRYQLTGENFVIRIEGGAHSRIPLVLVPQEDGPPAPLPQALDYFDWLAAGGVPLPAQLQAPSELAAELRQALALEYDQRMQIIAAGYPTSERESWPVQTEEGRALAADPAAATPWIDAAALARGIDRAELAQRICAKDDAYRQIHGALTGTRQRIEDQIDAAGDDAEALSLIDVGAGWPLSPV